MRFFFFGTLMDADVQALVLGRTLAGTRPAILTGYRCLRVVGEAFPCLRPDAREQVAGIVSAPLTRSDIARLSFYESADYACTRVVVSCDGSQPIEAAAFLGSERLSVTEEPWQIALWRRLEKPRFVEQTKRFMAGFDPALADQAIDHLWRQASVGRSPREP
jgi:hypothetical protein